MELKLTLILFLAVVLTACGNDTVESIQNIQNSEVAEIMDKADQDSYEPPADGQLTEDHIKMYLAVKKREAELRKSEADKVKKKMDKAEKADEESISGVMQNLDAMQQIASYVMLDIRAAQKLNYNTAEYEWVKNTLLDAASQSMLGNMEEMQKNMAKSMNESMVQLEKMRNETKDPQARAALDQQIQEMKQGMQEMEAEQQAMTPAEKHNIALYTKHKDEINIVENELNKFAGLDEKQ